MDESARLTFDDVKAAAAVGRLGDVARQLIFESHWAALDGLVQYAAQREITIDALVDAVRTMVETLAGLSETQLAANADEILAIRRHIARALSRRAGATPLTDAERNAAGLSGTIHAGLGDLRMAAELFERAGDDARAAEAFGALGDLDNMERCLSRDDARRSQRRAVSEGVRQAELLLATGARHAALEKVNALPPNDPESASVRAHVRGIERRLCRGRALSIKRPDGTIVRLCATPTSLGRDLAADLALRDPTVSRRHAVIADDRGAFALSDAGSRTGTRLAGVPLAGPVRIPDDAEIALGDHCRIVARRQGQTLMLRGTSGLDRALLAFISLGPELALDHVVAGAFGLSLSFAPPVVRLLRPASTLIRVGGRLVGLATDLLHGDQIEIVGGERLEIV